jgi:hypothetical protein
MSRKTKAAPENRLNGHVDPASIVVAPTINRPTPLKLDIGCGSNKAQGFWGCDQINFPGVDEVVDFRQPWPWADSSVTEIHCSHFLEHLTQQERVHFANELYRVLVPGVYQGGAPVAGFARIITPHWCAARAYGDPTHRWPPVSEWMYYYWNRIWRMGDPAMGAGPNAPHADMEHNPEGYNCDFDWNIAGSFNPALMVKSDGFKQDAVQWFKEAFQDTIATMTSRKKV